MQVRPKEMPAIQAAYIALHEFFDCYELHHALRLLESIVKAAASNKHWRKDAPFALQHFMQLLGQLCAAADTIDMLEYKRPDALLPAPEDGTVTDINLPGQFVDRRRLSTVWCCFPRHLTAKQYHNPYKAIRKFALAYPETVWKEKLGDLQEYAFSNHPITEVWEAEELLTIQKRLLQLVEACHLLEVRTNGMGEERKIVNGES